MLAWLWDSLCRPSSGTVRPHDCCRLCCPPALRLQGHTLRCATLALGPRGCSACRLRGPCSRGCSAHQGVPPARLIALDCRRAKLNYPGEVPLPLCEALLARLQDAGASVAHSAGPQAGPDGQADYGSGGQEEWEKQVEEEERLQGEAADG